MIYIILLCAGLIAYFLYEKTETSDENKRTKGIREGILLAYVGVVMIDCIYLPPWMIALSEYKQFKSVGHFPTFPPMDELVFHNYSAYHFLKADYYINYKRLILEAIVITAVFAILFVLTLRPKKII